ncbi:DUF3368 domain-containing protein [Leptolyngbya sp. NK1-12]|uniref:DUF3368 domain-containing protein n=1 Tax=Leptolyngbya sp. NK1-12 TaxID=2547451 RepID=A0AA97AGZ2_9CYAN|nr:DUF3368 domain-containing protein [Leptolyngbya sp. NK1-12]
MIIISNTTPLSELAKINHLDLLQALFRKILIPPAVYSELTTGNHPATTAIPVADWIEVRPVTNFQRVEQLLQTPGLDQGECAAIALAEELTADRLLIDEQAGRQLAFQLGIPVTGTIGILLVAKQANVISAVRPLVDAMIGQGKWISPAFYQQILQLADE